MKLVVFVLCAALDTIAGTKTVYDQLWDNNKKLAEKIWKLPYFQNLRKGDLQYVTYMLQDIKVLVAFTDCLNKRRTQGKNQEMKDFFEQKYWIYKAYTDATLKKFHLTGVKDIALIHAMDEYKKRTPINTEEDNLVHDALFILARERLWQWLFEEKRLHNKHPYLTWKKQNMSTDIGINHKLTIPIDFDNAKSAFNSVLMYEHNMLAYSE